jgi:hypothetical protein
MNKTLEEAADDLLHTYEEEFRMPFPYADCRKLRREGGDRYEGLIPDLDMYFSDIAGYCSWGKRILKWPKEKVLEVRERLSKSFFEKHPQYKPLEAMITESNTPSLYTRLIACEKLRLKLLEILTRLLTEERTEAPV